MTRLLVFLLLATASGGALAQPTPPRPPDVPAVVFSPEALDALFARPPRVEVNLRGAVLRLAAQSSGDDPATADLLRGLRGVTVRVYPLDAARAPLGDALARLGDAFAAHGWEPLVRVRGDADEDDVFVFVHAGETLLQGLAVAALDRADNTVSFVHIEGDIDPSQVGTLGARFGGVQVGTAREGGTVDALDRAEEARAEAERARERAAQQREDAERRRDEARREAERARDEARREAERARDEARRAREEANRIRTERPPTPPRP